MFSQYNTRSTAGFQKLCSDYFSAYNRKFFKNKLPTPVFKKTRKAGVGGYTYVDGTIIANIEKIAKAVGTFTDRKILTIHDSKSGKTSTHTLLTIGVSSEVLSDESTFVEVLLHEMCHAAVTFISMVDEDNIDKGHGPVFYSWCKKCGIAQSTKMVNENSNVSKVRELLLERGLGNVKSSLSELRGHTFPAFMYRPYRKRDLLFDGILAHVEDCDCFIFYGMEITSKKWYARIVKKADFASDPSKIRGEGAVFIGARPLNPVVKRKLSKESVYGIYRAFNTFKLSNRHATMNEDDVFQCIQTLLTTYTKA